MCCCCCRSEVVFWKSRRCHVVEEVDVNISEINSSLWPVHDVSCRGYERASGNHMIIVEMGDHEGDLKDASSILHMDVTEFASRNIYQTIRLGN